MKTTIRYLTPVRMIIMKKNKDNKFGKDIEKRDLSSLSEHVNYYNHYGE